MARKKTRKRSSAPKTVKVHGYTYKRTVRAYTRRKPRRRK